MTTIVNNPTPTTDSKGLSLLIGMMMIIGLIFVFFYFGLPAIKRMGPIEVNVPAPNVNLPDKINVNVNQE